VTAFLSYSSANRVFAAKLRDELAKLGLSVWSDGAAPGVKLPERIEAGIRSASDLLVLIGPRDGRDEEQELTWRSVLETVWKDSSKRLIPILLKDAPLPPFILSAFKLSSMDGADIPVVRVRDPRQVAEAARAIVQVARGEISRSREGMERRRSQAAEIREADPQLGYGIRDDGTKRGFGFDGFDVYVESSAAADAGSKAGYAVRLDEIGQLAKSLKPS